VQTLNEENPIVSTVYLKVGNEVARIPLESFSSDTAPSIPSLHVNLHSNSFNSVYLKIRLGDYIPST